MSSLVTPTVGDLVRTLYEFLRQNPDEVVNFEDVDNYGRMLGPQLVGEHEVGELPPDLKALCFLVNKFANDIADANDKYAESMEIEDGVEAAEALVSIACDKERYFAVLSLFTVSVKDYFNLWDREIINIRRGFKVVWTTEDEVLAATVPDCIFGRGSRIDS